MVLELSYTDSNFKKQVEDLVTKYPKLTFNAYDESHFQEKKKAFKLKGGYSARLSPFAVFKDAKHTIPFYSESHDCTIDNISEILNRYCHD